MTGKAVLDHPWYLAHCRIYRETKHILEFRILRRLAGAHPDRVAGMQGEVLRHAGDVSGLSLLTSIA